MDKPQWWKRPNDRDGYIRGCLDERGGVIDRLVGHIRAFRLMPVISTSFPRDTVALRFYPIHFLNASSFDATKYRNFAMWQYTSKTKRVHAACNLQPGFLIGP